MRFILAILVALTLFAHAKNAHAQPPEPTIKTIADWIQACRSSLPPHKAHQYANYIYRSSQKHNVEPALAVALISVESNFNPREVSSAGAVGLTQIMPFDSRLRAWRVSRGGLMRPDINIDKGLGLYATFKQEANGNRVKALNKYVGHGYHPKPTRYTKVILRRTENLKEKRYHRIGKEL